MSPGQQAARSSGRRPLPGGTVTFLFTDIEGSTRHLQEVGAERYAEALAEHRQIVRRACAQADGVEVDNQGDAFFVAFADATRAAGAAQAIAGALGDGPMRVRIGLHTGRPLVGEEGYVGEDVHLGARIAASGHGGQVLISRATREAIGKSIEVADLGEHRLKDIAAPIPIYQLGPGDFPPLKTISNTNLPRPADSFLGRERELEEIVARLRNGARLLTLLGPGGTGKTRLAIEAAATLVPDFKAGTFWVDLSPVRDSDAVAGAVSATFKTEQDAAEYIGEREMLLILDNLEQVIDAAPWVGSLVTACPNLRVMVTSRERLRVRGEASFDVPPLGQTDASRLFADRSGVTPASDIDELCARLENLPLAVELAAARTTTLTPRQILDRLDDRLDLLKGGRDADPRQRTLRATIEWSHDLLNAVEKRIFRRLSVFAGGATLEAVEAVCESDLDTVESLIDKSLVRSDDGRFKMLETIREYAAERLDAAGERADVQHRHAEWLQEIMAARVPALAGGGSDELAHSLAAEFANLQAAVAWLVETGDAAAAAGMIDTAWWFVDEFLSQSRAGLAMCDAVLAMPGVAATDRALIRHREGNFAISLGELDRARDAWTEAAELAHRVGDAVRESSVIQNLSLNEADPAEALRLFEHATSLRPIEDERHRYRTQWNLAFMKRRAGDLAAVEAIYAEIVDWANRVGDHQYMAAGEREMGELALDRGHVSEALERGTRSRDVGASRGHALAELLAESLRGRAAVRLGLRDDAIASLAATMDLVRRGDLEATDEVAGDVLGSAVEVLAGLGETDLAADLELARRRIIEALPSRLDHAERLHAAWLSKNGVEPSTKSGDIDRTTAFARVRDWLARRGAPAPDRSASD